MVYIFHKVKNLAQNTLMVKSFSIYLNYLSKMHLKLSKAF